MVAMARRRCRFGVPLPASVGVAQEEIGNTGDLSALRWTFLVVTSVLVFASIALVAVVTVRLVDHGLRLSVPSAREDQRRATSA